MRVLFQSEQLNYRGTTHSMVDFAKYNQEILGNESVIIYNENSPMGIDVGNEDDAIEQLSEQFQVLSYNNADQLNEIASQFDLCYSQRSGMAKGSVYKDTAGNIIKAEDTGDYERNTENAMVTSTRFGIHSVFQWHGFHGDAFAYVSEWLARKIQSDHELDYTPDFVPLIVNSPEPTRSLREELGIPKDKFVIGRLGGYATFDLEFVWDAIQEIVNTRTDIVFLFANTMPFYNHPNIIHLDPFFDHETRSNFVHTCDAMVHGQKFGETFGLAISEFLFQNKPVVAWEGGINRNHTMLLKDNNLLYTKETALQKILDLPALVGTHDYKKIVEPFSPKNVMAKFEQVFLAP